MATTATTLEQFDQLQRSLRQLLVDHIEAGGTFSSEYDNGDEKSRLLSVTLIPKASRDATFLTDATPSARTEAK